MKRTADIYSSSTAPISVFRRLRAWRLLDYSLLIICLLLLDAGCGRSPTEHKATIHLDFFEGEQVPSTEYFFPMQQFDFMLALPKVSPDGTYLAYRRFYSIPQESVGVYLMDMTTGVKSLLVNSALASSPDWSPGGQWITLGNNQQVYKIKINGDSLMQLTTGPGSFHPTWSPDGEYISFAGNSAYNLMRNDGTGIKKVGDELFGAPVDWYPDGTKLLGVKGYSASSVWLQFPVLDVFLDSTVQILSAANGYSNQFAQYSPDGSRIVFWNEKGIWVMNSDGKELHNILPLFLRTSEVDAPGSDSGVYALPGAWFPDSRHLLYEHFQITRFRIPSPGDVTGVGTEVEGYLSFYKVDVDTAIARAYLPW